MDVSKYAALFLAESREHLNLCNQLLLQWERDPKATEAIGGLFRAIHSIKGMGATMEYLEVADLAHRLENLLDALRHGRVKPGPATFELLFRAVDALAVMVERSPSRTASPADPALASELEAAVATEAPAEPVERAGRRARASRRKPSPLPQVRPVQVVIRSDAPMRGARAALVVGRARGLGQVSAVHPGPAQFERDDFDGRLSFRLESRATDEEIAAALAGAGDVERVRFVEDGDPQSAIAGQQRQIRVDLRHLDALMNRVGELVVAKNRLSALGSGDPALAELGDHIARLVSGMQADVIAARLTPVGEVFDRFPRLVRDLARDLGKRILFEVQGREIELDRSMLDEIGDPLVHLIRNAADHGIETPGVRSAVGKPPEGRILLAAERDRNTVSLRIADDGRGMDRVAILAQARREGLADGSTDELSDDLLLRVLARPGFTTAHEVSGVSGRGVGVDAALTRVRALGGTLEVHSELGRGTTFVIRVPLTLAIVRALLADAGGERYAVPLSYVAETIEFDPRAVTALRGQEALVIRDRVVPTVHLGDLVAGRRRPPAARQPTVILEVGDRRSALVVDALLGQQDIVVEPFDAPRGVPAFVGGATILADGAPALILDASALL